jgi:predicted phage terminase large subunit-like protein
LSTHPNQVQELIEQEFIRREFLKKDLIEFTKLFEPHYMAGWVHKDICHRLERFSQEIIMGRSPRLMLLMPPRHGKSLLASQIFPAWHLGHRPDHEIINVGYNVDLPTRFSRRVREVLQQEEYHMVFPETQLDTRSQSVEAWLTTKRGGFTAAGRGGGITGKGAHVLIVDDPIKNMEEADNFEIREKLEDWYFSTAYTRLAPGGGVLIIETMWHDDDLAGRLMTKMEFEEDADQFEVIRYPAVSTEFEYRHKDTYEMTRSDIHLVSLAGSEEYELLRPPGVALHEDRYSLEYLQRVKANMSSRIWSALYQQNPVPEEGLFFRKDMIHLSPVTPKYSNRRFYIAWDFAISEKQRADYTVGVTLMQDEYDNLYVVDLVRFKGDMHRISNEFISMIQRWSQFDGSSIQLGVEDGQIWKSLKPILKAQMREERAYVSIETMQALTDKENRARALQGRMEHKRFWFFEESPWIQDVKRELLRFPAGRHDDIVDALAWAVRLATGKVPKKPPARKKLKSWKDDLSQFMGGSRGSGHLSA